MADNRHYRSATAGITRSAINSNVPGSLSPREPRRLSLDELPASGGRLDAAEWASLPQSLGQ
jgi:hypothetical protein